MIAIDVEELVIADWYYASCCVSRYELGSRRAVVPSQELQSFLSRVKYLCVCAKAIQEENLEEYVDQIQLLAKSVILKPAQRNKCCPMLSGKVVKDNA